MSGGVTILSILTGVYVIAILVVGVYVAREWIGDEGDFMVAGREIGGFVTGSSLVALLYSGGFVPYLVLLGFRYGVGGGWFFWSFSVGILLVAVTWLGFWRRTGGYTPPEYFEARHGPAGRLALVFAVFVFVFFAGAFQYVGAAGVVAGAFGIDFTSAVLLLGVVVVVYVVLSGIWGISITDLIQFLWVGSTVFLAVPLYLLWRHGLPVAGSPAIEPGMLTFPHGTMPVWELASETVVSLLLLNVILASGPHYWVRAQACRNPKAARRGWFLAAAVALVSGLVGALVGLWARRLVDPAAPIEAFGVLLAQETPVWLGALALSGIVAATMSTIDLVYQTGANTVTRDLLQRYRGIDDPDVLLRYSRASIVGIAVITIVIAVAFPGTLGDLIAFAFALLVPFFVLSLDSWLVRYGTGEGTAVMVGANVPLVFYWEFVADVAVDVMWPATAVSFALFYLASAVARRRGLRSADARGRGVPEQSREAELAVLDVVQRGFSNLADVMDVGSSRLDREARDSTSYARTIDRLVERGDLERESERFEGRTELRLTAEGEAAAPSLSATERELVERHGVSLDALCVLAAVRSHRDETGRLPTIDDLQQPDRGADTRPAYAYSALFNQLVDAGLAVERGIVRFRIEPTAEGETLLEEYDDRR